MTGFTKAKIALALVCIMLLTVVVFQNTAAVDIKVLFFHFPISCAVLLVLTFSMGVVAGLLMAYLLSGRKSTAG